MNETMRIVAQAIHEERARLRDICGPEDHMLTKLAVLTRVAQRVAKNYKAEHPHFNRKQFMYAATGHGEYANE